MQVEAALGGFEAGSLQPGPALQAFDHVFGGARPNDTAVAVLYGAIGAPCLRPLHLQLATASQGAACLLLSSKSVWGCNKVCKQGTPCQM